MPLIPYRPKKNSFDPFPRGETTAFRDPNTQFARQSVIQGAPEINPLTATVEGRMAGLMERNNPYMQRARHRGTTHANKRGLQNSSIAAGASEASAIDAALPIAQADAKTYSAYGLNEQNQRHSLEGAEQTQRHTLAGARQTADLSKELIGAEYDRKEGVQRRDIAASQFEGFSKSMQAIEAMRLSEISQVQKAEGLSEKAKTNAITQINKLFSKDTGSFRFLESLHEKRLGWKWDVA